MLILLGEMFDERFTLLPGEAVFDHMHGFPFANVFVSFAVSPDRVVDSGDVVDPGMKPFILPSLHLEQSQEIVASQSRSTQAETELFDATPRNADIWIQAVTLEDPSVVPDG